MDDLISRQAAIEEVSKGCEELRGVFKRCKDNLSSLPPVKLETCKYWDDESNYCALYRPSAQPEPTSDVEFWRKRANYYRDMCMDLINEMEKGVNNKPKFHLKIMNTGYCPDEEGFLYGIYPANIELAYD